MIITKQKIKPINKPEDNFLIENQNLSINTDKKNKNDKENNNDNNNKELT